MEGVPRREGGRVRPVGDDLSGVIGYCLGNGAVHQTALLSCPGWRGGACNTRLFIPTTRDYGLFEKGFPSRRDGKSVEGSMPVAGKCDVCGKAKTFGNNVSFSKRRTSRDFRPNVHKKRIIVNGVGVRLN